MEEFSYESFIKNHFIFEQLNDFKNFYFSISENSSRKPTMGIQSPIPLNSYFFESIKNTIDSIIILLEKGRLGDAYVLMRRYYELILFQTYTDLKSKNEFSVDNLIVMDINNWVLNKKKAPSIKKISNYIEKSELINPINSLFISQKNIYDSIRTRCNDFTHFNNIDSIIFQANYILHSGKINNEIFQLLINDSLYLFIKHFAFIFFLNGVYLTDEDYFVSLDAGLFKVEEEAPWTSPIIKIAFDKYIKPNHPEVAELLTEKLNGVLK